MKLLIKFKFLFLILFFICLCISLYYYFNNYTTSVKQEYTDSKTAVIISFKSNENFNEQINEKIVKKLQQLLIVRHAYLSALLSKNFEVKYEDVNNTQNSLTFIINHNYKFDQKLMEDYAKNFFEEFLHHEKQVSKELNEFITSDFESAIKKLEILKITTKENAFDLILKNDFYEIDILTDDFEIISSKFPDSITPIFFNYGNIKSGKIILQIPTELNIDDFVNISIYNIEENQLIITGYNELYYLLILFGFINILLYFLIYLKQRKII